MRSSGTCVNRSNCPISRPSSSHEYRVTKKSGDYIPYRNEPGDVPPMANFGVGYRYHITGLFHDPQGFPTQRLDEIDPWLERVNTKLEKHLDDILMVEED